MLPRFPHFKKLELTDRSCIEDFTKRYPPYSDFSFTSLYIWNIADDTRFTTHNDSLIIKMKDYVSEKPVFTFLGDHFDERIVNILLLYVMKEKGCIKLLPESITYSEIIKDLLIEDPDQHDYIYAIEEIVNLTGGKYKKKRNMCKRFMRENVYTIREIDIRSPESQKEVLHLFYQWQTSRRKEFLEVHNEFLALQRLFAIASSIKLLSVAVYVNGVLEALTISEMLHNGYSIIHFQKYNAAYIGLAEYLFIETLRGHITHGAICLNYEQDLGIEGLRQAKALWRPSHYLKKFSIKSTALLD